MPGKPAGIVAAVLFLLPAAAVAQDPTQAFDKTETLVAMRDGARLNTHVYVPKSAREPLPIILFRTPYGIENRPRGMFGGYFKELAEEGYIFAFQDIRGRYKSEGRFVMIRPPRDKSDPRAIDESTDTYDTIEWLLKTLPNDNGRVGMLGISYDGWTTVMGMLDPHPALRAASPQASPADMWIGDDFHHNGAFRLSYGFEYVALMETTHEQAVFKFDRHDTYEWYLALGALSNANARHFQGKLPTWNDFVAHPNYDEFWKRQAFDAHLDRVAVPTLNVAGWWDQEDFYGPLRIYELLERKDAKGMNFLVVGPWNHGGWGRGEGTALGRIAFGAPTARHFREKIQAPFFAFHLKDKGRLDLPEALTFRTGANAWTRHDAWPPRRDVAPRRLHFHADGRLSFDPPREEGETASDAYVSDPARPVPYRPRPIEPTYGGPGWGTWLVEDQRFVHLRPDVLSWETEPLAEDVTVSGRVVVHLYGATSGGDCDWIAKLIDVHPALDERDSKMSGYQLMIGGDVVRARFRKSFERPEPVAPGEVNEYRIDLRGTDHRFRKGHRIMVQVQSTWFPVIDRNPQTWVPNIFEAKDADYRPATQRVFRSARFPSHVLLPVMSP